MGKMGGGKENFKLKDKPDEKTLSSIYYFSLALEFYSPRRGHSACLTINHELLLNLVATVNVGSLQRTGTQQLSAFPQEGWSRYTLELTEALLPGPIKDTCRATVRFFVCMSR